MRRTLGLIVVVGLSVSIVTADEKPTPPQSNPTTLTPQQELRLAKLAGAQPQKIGLYTYYPNAGGGYTFLEGKRIAFYALPYLPTTHEAARTIFVRETRNGITTQRPVVETVTVVTIEKSKMPFGGQTLYRPGTKNAQSGPTLAAQRLSFVEDIPIARWTRDTPGGKFRLSIMAEDSETRTKLKSIVPVLERAPKP